LPAFEAAVKAHVGAVMDSYNLTTDNMSQNGYFLTDVLKKEWVYGL
jgi:beta-glucosidase-like glycosyl hydrolase